MNVATGSPGSGKKTGGKGGTTPSKQSASYFGAALMWRLSRAFTDTASAP